MEEKVAPLYAKVEDAISDLETQFKETKAIKFVIAHLKAALKEADE